LSWQDLLTREIPDDATDRLSLSLHGIGAPLSYRLFLRHVSDMTTIDLSVTGLGASHRAGLTMAQPNLSAHILEKGGFTP